MDNNQFKEADDYAQQAMSLAKSSSDQSSMAMAYDCLGHLYQAKFDYTNAMKQYLEGLKIRDQLADQKGIATSKSNIGRIFFLQENLNKAEENLQTALGSWKELNDPKGLAVTNLYLGDVFLQKEIYGRAKQYYKQALEYKKQSGDVAGASELASFLGKIEYDLGDNDGAMVYYEMSLDFNQMLGDETKIAEDYYNISLAYLAQGAYEDALDENEAAEEIWRKLGDDFGLAQATKNYGIIYASMGDKKEAEKYLQKSAEYVKVIGAEPGTPQIYKSLAEGYNKIGNTEMAYKYHMMFSKNKDILFNKEKDKALFELTTKYESEFATEQKEKQIEILEVEKASSAKVKYFLYAVIGLIGILLGTLFFSYKRKKKDNELLTVKNEEINEKNDEIKEKNAHLDQLNSKLVDEMAERESIEESSFARDRFLATMSHEMRTPMNAIIGLTHLLLKDNPRGDQIESLRTLQFSANNMTVFINDVLDFSKIEAGKLILESREFEPKKTFDDVNERFMGVIENKGLVFNYEYDKKIPGKLLGDPARLNQILTNLVANALNLTNKGFINLNVKLHEYKKQEAVVFISVTDSGDGMDTEILDHMFKKYGPGEDDNFEGYDKSGLGLAITKRFVDLQNGLIEVHSEPGQGTSIRLFLPFKIVEEELTPVTNDKGEMTFDHLSGNRVLIVEDNKINQLVVAKILRKLGIEAITCDNGQEGVEMVQKHDFDLILMDIQMPVMDGYRSTAEIRKLADPKKADVPIIALTASAFLSEKEKAKLFGMNDHIGKPFGPEELLEKISVALQPKVVK